jgi:hypothetical protein
MKILIVGDWSHPMYEKAFKDALMSLGHEVIQCSYYNYFKSPLGKFETKYCFAGPMTYLFNRYFISTVALHKPHIVLIWRGTNILPLALKKLRRLGVEKITSYNHDDFTGPEIGAPVPWYHKRLWRLYLKCAPLIDHHFVKRDSNIAHLLCIGAKNAHIMPMWFVPQIHKPVHLSISEHARFDTDVVFVGHYEPDGREDSIRALVLAGIQVKLWGGHYWSRSVLGDLYEQLAPIVHAEGAEYAKALCGAKVCLCFLSKLNRDTYTRRCFEIPACGKVMLAERTDVLMQFFKEDEEACFFSSQEELVSKVKWLINNPDIRESIAQAGLRRVWTDGHDITSRARKFLENIS